MADKNNNCSGNITRKYYTMWNSNISLLPNETISLKDIYCLPDFFNQNKDLVDIGNILNGIANTNIKITLIQGVAGIGKSAFISYLCNNNQVLGTDVGIMVWSSPQSNISIRSAMDECNQYSHLKDFKRMILVFEDFDDYKIGIGDFCKTIKQKQETLYPNISVILTCRETDVSGLSVDCCSLFIQPLSKERVSHLVQLYCSKANIESDKEKITQSLLRNFGNESIGNPVILLLLLSSVKQNIAITTESDLYSLLINKSNFKDNLVLFETIAFLGYLRQSFYIPIESLYEEMKAKKLPNLQYQNITTFTDILRKRLSGICVLSGDTIGFVHKLYFDYSLAVFLFNQIKQTDFPGNMNNVSLNNMLSSGVFNAPIFSFLKSLLKDVEKSQIDRIQKKWSKYYLNYLYNEKTITPDAISNNCLSEIVKQEMAFFYNITSIYHIVLESNRSTRLFSNNSVIATKKLLFYLNLYSFSDYDAVLDLSSMDFSRCDFSNLNLSKIDFSYCKLTACNFKNSELTYVKLATADLSSSNFQRTQLIHVDFEKSNLRSVTLADSMLISCTMNSSNLHFADLSRSILRNVDLSYANLHGSNLDSVICKMVNFRFANMAESYLANIILNDVILEDANLKGAFINLDS